MKTITPPNPADPFASQLEANGKCLIWTGPRYGADGYGMFKSGGRIYLAHRYAWEQDQGAPPQGALLQTCGNKACCAQVHLKPVPKIVPVQRAGGVSVVEKGR